MSHQEAAASRRIELAGTHTAATGAADLTRGAVPVRFAILARIDDAVSAGGPAVTGGRIALAPNAHCRISGTPSAGTPIVSGTTIVVIARDGVKVIAATSISADVVRANVVVVAFGIRKADRARALIQNTAIQPVTPEGQVGGTDALPARLNTNLGVRTESGSSDTASLRADIVFCAGPVVIAGTGIRGVRAVSVRSARILRANVIVVAIGTETASAALGPACYAPAQSCTPKGIGIRTNANSIWLDTDLIIRTRPRGPVTNSSGAGVIEGAGPAVVARGGIERIRTRPVLTRVVRAVIVVIAVGVRHAGNALRLAQDTAIQPLAPEGPVARTGTLASRFRTSLIVGAKSGGARATALGATVVFGASRTVVARIRVVVVSAGSVLARVRRAWDVVVAGGV